MSSAPMTDALTGQTVELLQTLIRNECVNDGTPTSGHESRSAEVLQTFLEGSGLEIQRYEPTAGRASLVARLDGHDPDAPAVCLMGHTDVVPVNPDGWSRDPFGGELIDGEVWGRGAVDMLNLTASMAVAVRELARRGWRPRGDLIYFAVADEESGSAHGAQWMADHAADAIRCDYLLTESGGIHSGPSDAPQIGVNVGEKGVAWRRLRVRGTPGHGSAPYRSDNALVKAAAVIQRLTAYAPAPRVHEMWRRQVESFQLDEATTAMLLDPDHIDDAIAALAGDDPARLGLARHLHACSHTTFSCNVVEGPMKTNTIPSVIDIGVDIRTLPGEGAEDVQAHLDAALGDLADTVEVEVVMNDAASISRIDNPMWDALQRAMSSPFPTSRMVPQLMAGFTDARIFRRMGAIAYGTGLFSPDLPAGDYATRFHGNDERIDVESLRLTTQLWLDVVTDVMS